MKSAVLTAAIVLPVIGIAAWVGNNWVVTHALFSISDSGYVLVAKGWTGLWLQAAGGILVGLVIGVLAGAHTGRLAMTWINRWYALSRRKLRVERQELKIRKARLGSEIIEATVYGRKEGAREIKKERTARRKAEDRARILELRIDYLQSQLSAAKRWHKSANNSDDQAT